MNKVIYINFGGRLIPIEEIAQTSLEAYLEQLRKSFSSDTDAEEILTDMKYRISELFEQILKSGKHCIEQKDIDAIIGIMGTPEAIQENIAEEPTTQQNAQQEQRSNNDAPNNNDFKNEQRSKFYANSNDKIIGGVCGGLARYLNIDPALIRIAFALITLAWGTGIIVYILLWIFLPKANDQPLQFKKRLYRNPENKKISGVCSGLAAYFNIDTVIVRGIFIAPIIISLLSWNVFGWMSLPFSWGAFPTMIIIYILLTIAIPEAKTVTEKMAMNGEKIDFENIKAAYDNTANQANVFIKENKNVFARIITIIVKIIVGFFIGIGLFAMATLIIGILTALIINDNNVINAIAFYDIITRNEIYSLLSKIAAVALLLIPVYFLAGATKRLITGNKHKSTLTKTLHSVLAVVFFTSIITLVYIGKQTSKMYKSEVKTTETFDINHLPKDTLYIYPKNKLDDFEHLIGNIFIDENQTQLKVVNNIFVKEGTDSTIRITTDIKAQGATKSSAKKNADIINAPYLYANNNLLLPEFSEYNAGINNNFNFQNVSYTITIPKGMPYKFVDFDSEYIERRNTIYTFKIKSFGISSKRKIIEIE